LSVDSVLQNQQLINGRTGNVSFNSAGDRVNAVYEVVNVQSQGSVVVGNCTVDNVSWRDDCWLLAKQLGPWPLSIDDGASKLPLVTAICWVIFETFSPSDLAIKFANAVVTKDFTSSYTCCYTKKGRGFPYWLPSIGPGADPGVQGVSQQVTKSSTRR